eukprot:scaffold576483_cov55-Attheya_sp.AAC.1
MVRLLQSRLHRRRERGYKREKEYTSINSASAKPAPLVLDMQQQQQQQQAQEQEQDDHDSIHDSIEPEGLRQRRQRCTRNKSSKDSAHHEDFEIMANFTKMHPAVRTKSCLNADPTAVPVHVHSQQFPEQLPESLESPHVKEPFGNQGLSHEHTSHYDEFEVVAQFPNGAIPPSLLLVQEATDAQTPVSPILAESISTKKTDREKKSKGFKSGRRTKQKPLKPTPDQFEIVAQFPKVSLSPSSPQIIDDDSISEAPLPPVSRSLMARASENFQDYMDKDLKSKQKKGMRNRSQSLSNPTHEEFEIVADFHQMSPFFNNAYDRQTEIPDQRKGEKLQQSAIRTTANIDNDDDPVTARWLPSCGGTTHSVNSIEEEAPGAASTDKSGTSVTNSSPNHGSQEVKGNACSSVPAPPKETNENKIRAKPFSWYPKKIRFAGVNGSTREIPVEDSVAPKCEFEVLAEFLDMIPSGATHPVATQPDIPLLIECNDRPPHSVTTSVKGKEKDDQKYFDRGNRDIEAASTPVAKDSEAKRKLSGLRTTLSARKDRKSPQAGTASIQMLELDSIAKEIGICQNPAEPIQRIDETMVSERLNDEQSSVSHNSGVFDDIESVNEASDKRKNALVRRSSIGSTEAVLCL